MKPKVLIIIGAYLPGQKSGGPIRTTANLIEWLSDEFDMYVLTADHDSGDATPYDDITYGDWNQVGRSKVRYLSASEMKPRHMASVINQLDTHFDMVYLDSVFATITVKYLLILRLGWISKQKYILAPRGNLQPEVLQRKKVKKRFFLSFARFIKLYESIKYWHTSSDYESDSVKRIFGDKANTIAIPNLPGKRTSTYDIAERSIVKNPGEAKFVIISRINRTKNLHYALHLLKNLERDVILHIYGYMEEVDYWNECQTIIDTLPKNIQVAYCGVVASEAVLDTFAQYHAFLFPTISENFGHVVIESLSAGCLVITTDGTPWDNIQEKGVGWYLSLHDPDSFVSAIQDVLNMDQATFLEMSQRANQYARDFSNSSSTNETIDLFHRVILKKGEDDS